MQREMVRDAVRKADVVRGLLFIFSCCFEIRLGRSARRVSQLRRPRWMW